MSIRIEGRKDLVNIIYAFYQKAMVDTTIGYIFTDIANLNLEEHLPRIIDFWESVLFGTAQYQGNPVLKHISLHQISSLRKEHFDRWLAIWNEVIDRDYSGEIALEAKKKAKIMADLMMYKIAASEDEGFVQ